MGDISEALRIERGRDEADCSHYPSEIVSCAVRTREALLVEEALDLALYGCGLVQAFQKPNRITETRSIHAIHCNSILESLFIPSVTGRRSNQAPSCGHEPQELISDAFAVDLILSIWKRCRTCPSGSVEAFLTIIPENRLGPAGCRKRASLNARNHHYPAQANCGAGHHRPHRT